MLVFASSSLKVGATSQDSTSAQEVEVKEKTLHVRLFKLGKEIYKKTVCDVELHFNNNPFLHII
jgi:hypothetical protein